MSRRRVMESKWSKVVQLRLSLRLGNHGVALPPLLATLVGKGTGWGLVGEENRTRSARFELWDRVGGTSHSLSHLDLDLDPWGFGSLGHLLTQTPNRSYTLVILFPSRSPPTLSFLDHWYLYLSTDHSTRLPSHTILNWNTVLCSLTFV